MGLPDAIMGLPDAAMGTDTAGDQKRLTVNMQVAGGGESLAAKEEHFAIDPNGDVILRVRSTSHLLISSKILSLSCRPFESMFSSRFLEGQNLSSTSPPTVDFPEDNPWAMYAVCQILHNKPTAGVTSTADCVELLVVADKYDLTRCIQAQVTLWGREQAAQMGQESAKVETPAPASPNPSQSTRPELANSNPHLDGLLDLIISSYATSDNKLFRDISEAVISQTSHKDSLVRASSRVGAHLVPAELWTYLSEQRVTLRSRLITDLRLRVVEAKDPSHTQIPLSFLTNALHEHFGTDSGAGAPTGLVISEILTLWERHGIPVRRLLDLLGGQMTSYLKDGLFDGEIDLDALVMRGRMMFAWSVREVVEGCLRRWNGVCVECVRRGAWPVGKKGGCMGACAQEEGDVVDG